MPYGKKSKRTFRRRKRKRRSRKAVLSSTAVAKIARKVARVQIHQDRVTLVKRQWWFGDYDSDLNLFTGGLDVSNSGLIVPLTNIRILDLDTLVPQPVTPLQYEVNPTPPYSGNTITMPTMTIQGSRTGNEVKISGFKIKLRVVLKKVPPADDPASGAPDYLQNVGPFLLSRMRFYYKIFYLTKPFTGPDQPPSSAWKPDIEKCLPAPKSWGFSRALDIQEQQEIQHLKLKTLASGSFSMSYSQEKQRTKMLTISRRLKRCLKIVYDPRSQDGTNTHFGKIYMALRTDVPFDVNQALLFADYYPKVWGVSKLYYHQE